MLSLDRPGEDVRPGRHRLGIQAQAGEARAGLQPRHERFPGHPYLGEVLLEHRGPLLVSRRPGGRQDCRLMAHEEFPETTPMHVQRRPRAWAPIPELGAAHQP